MSSRLRRKDIEVIYGELETRNILSLAYLSTGSLFVEHLVYVGSGGCRHERHTVSTFGGCTAQELDRCLLLNSDYKSGVCDILLLPSTLVLLFYTFPVCAPSCPNTQAGVFGGWGHTQGMYLWHV